MSIIITAPTPPNAPEGYQGYAGWIGPYQFARGKALLDDGETITPWVYGHLVRMGCRISGQAPPPGIRSDGDPAHDGILLSAPEAAIDLTPQVPTPPDEKPKK